MADSTFKYVVSKAVNIVLKVEIGDAAILLDCDQCR